MLIIDSYVMKMFGYIPYEKTNIILIYHYQSAYVRIVASKIRCAPLPKTPSSKKALDIYMNTLISIFTSYYVFFDVGLPVKWL